MNPIYMTQREFIHQYNKNNRPRFNDYFFDRKDEDIIQALRDVVYSCERSNIFTIKVLSFEVIDNYDDINHILWAYEESIINKGKVIEEKEASSSSKSKKSSNVKKKDNPFSYINLKDSDLKLIKVTYYIEINEKKNGLVHDTITVYIAVPRIVDGFYFRLNGNIYSAIYQIVDASTYNNATAKNAKKQSVTLKSLFMAIRVYRYYGKLVDITGKVIPTTYFIINIFKKSTLLAKYFLAKMGVSDAANFFGLKDVFVIHERDLGKIDVDINYLFPVRDMIITCPKILFDNNQICQSFVYTLYSVINYMQDYSFPNVLGKEMFTKALGAEFTLKDINAIYAKGISILDSLDFIYDIPTMKDLKLEMDDKATIYHVLRWIAYEFNSLRQKDNLDVRTKKIVITGIYRISDKGASADLNTMRKALQVPPMYLINAMTNNAIAKCQLVNYKNCANDLDALIALKYTFKGVSGIGERANAISNSYRAIHPSHLGILDPDSSSNSDPGVSGTICPLAKIIDNHFTDYMEPSTWRAALAALNAQYFAEKSKGKKQMYHLIKQEEK